MTELTIDRDIWFEISDRLNEFFTNGSCPFCLDGIAHDECKLLPNDIELTLGEFLDKIVDIISECKKN